ncbi:MAG: type II toxin-antitoxin system HicA family toxin [Candidatus Nomurabacteria bacterium]|nr:type II toxin-antitoxin system HicA family toxin [Candidatus Nomurabacteria bacterium]
MPKLPRVSAKDLIRVFNKLGFRIITQKGSHIKMQDEDRRTVIIPNHKQIKLGTLKNGIMNPLDISVEQLIKLLKN